MRLKIFCGFLLFIFACSKLDELKQPTSIGFDLGLSATQFLNGELVFNNGYIQLSDFIFDGERTEGSAVYFNTGYEKTIQVPFKKPALETMTFDVPQGIYTSINIRLGTEEKPSVLVLEGEWHPNSAAPVYVQLELRDVEQWSIIAKNSARQQQPLTLTAQKATASMVLQPHLWITNEQLDLWQMAETSLVNGRTTLLVNSTTNVALYEAIHKLFITNMPCALIES
jgi:hypothetical protein